MYDDTNIFAKILRGEIPCNKVYEDDYVLAFYDIAPKAPVHVVVIPKAKVISFTDFAQGDISTVGSFFHSLENIIKDLGLEEHGYRLISNAGENGGQEVPHFHMHILGGTHLGRIVP